MSIKAWEKFGDDNPAVANLVKTIRYKDSIHLVKVTKILDEEGWIGKDKIGQLPTTHFF